MTLEIDIDADGEWDSIGGWDGLIRRAAEAAIAESAFPQLTSSGRPVELSVRLTGDETMRALNSDWRGKAKATNVLSFPLADEDELRAANGPELMLGDIVLSRGVCTAEAANKGISVEDHATHLVVHGTLHLLGYDHHDDSDAEDMERREARALARLGIANPYADTI